MTFHKSTVLSVVSLHFLLCHAAAYANPGFTEDFTSSSQGWVSRTFAPLSHNATGGPDGGAYVSFDSSFDPFGGESGAIAFRGHDDFDASNDAFVADWIDNHWITLSAWVRHDGPAPASFFARIATPNNFPGAALISFVPVAPNTWTQLIFDVRPNSPQLILEGPTVDYSDVFGDVGNVQLGLTAPAGYEDDTTPITFALDKVTVATPEPASCGLLLLAIGSAVLQRRK